MDASIISEVVLPIVFIVVGIVLIWALVELVKFMRNTTAKVNAMEAEITPILKDVHEITESVKPAADKVDPLVERVSLAVDAANLEIMRLDGILENVNGITETAASAVDAVDTVANSPLRLVNTATEKLREAFSSRKVSEESASLAGASEQSASCGAFSSSEEPVGQGKAASDSSVACDADAPVKEGGVEFRVDVESCAPENVEHENVQPKNAVEEKYFTYGAGQDR